MSRRSAPPPRHHVAVHALLLVLSSSGLLRAETLSAAPPQAHTELPASPGATSEAATSEATTSTATNQTETPQSPIEASELSSARRAELARKQGHLGLAAYAEGRWRPALDHFTAAERWMHSPVFLLYAARCQHRLGSVDLARAAYQRILAEDWAEGAPAAWTEARASARRELAALEPTPPSVHEAAPSPEARGAPDPAPSGAGLPPGDLVVVPPRLDSPAAFSDVRDEVYPYRTGSYAAFGVGLAGLVAGTITGGMAWSEADAIRSRCEGSRCLATDEPKAHDARRLAHVATAGFVVAATGAIAGLTLWFLPAPAGHDVSVRLSPTQATLRASF